MPAAAEKGENSSFIYGLDEVARSKQLNSDGVQSFDHGRSYASYQASDSILYCSERATCIMHCTDEGIAFADRCRSTNLASLLLLG